MKRRRNRTNLISFDEWSRCNVDGEPYNFFIRLLPRLDGGRWKKMWISVFICLQWEGGGGGRCAEMKLHFKHWGRSSWALIKYFIPPSLILRFHVPRIFSRQIKRNKKRKRRAPKVAGWRDLWIFERKSRLTNRYFVCWSTKGLLIIYINLRLHFSPPSTKRAPGSRRCVGS